MISKREALVAGLVVVAGSFGALAAGAAVVGQAFEQLANAFSEAQFPTPEGEDQTPVGQYL